jgi:hypothetical protein
MNSTVCLHPDSKLVRREHTVIVTQRVGRLGNQLFLLGNLLALHQATGVTFSHAALGEYGLYFEGTRHDLLCRYPLEQAAGSRLSATCLGRKFAYFSSRCFDRVDNFIQLRRSVVSIDYKETFNLSEPAFVGRINKHKRTWLTGGWRFQYPTIGRSFLPAARRFFALVEPYASNVSNLVANARANAEILIGVHIRQTDFREHAGGKFYFTTAQYAALMHQAANIFPERKVHFLLVSDEDNENYGLGQLVCYRGTGVAVEDMYALGKCDYIISSAASSFSLWPSVLYQVPNYRISDPERRISISDFKTTTEPWLLAG